MTEIGNFDIRWDIVRGRRVEFGREVGEKVSYEVVGRKQFWEGLGLVPVRGLDHSLGELGLDRLCPQECELGQHTLYVGGGFPQSSLLCLGLIATRESGDWAVMIEEDGEEMGRRCTCLASLSEFVPLVQIEEDRDGWIETLDGGGRSVNYFHRGWKVRVSVACLRRFPLFEQEVFDDGFLDELLVTRLLLFEQRVKEKGGSLLKGELPVTRIVFENERVGV